MINEAKPDFVCVRRLWIHQASRLMGLTESGGFIEQTPEGAVLELRGILDGISSDATYFTCDHTNNYIQVHGEIGKEKPRMLGIIDRFLSLPDADRQRHYESMPSVI